MLKSHGRESKSNLFGLYSAEILVSLHMNVIAFSRRSFPLLLKYAFDFVVTVYGLSWLCECNEDGIGISVCHTLFYFY